jgi:hypothetical protein
MSTFEGIAPLFFFFSIDSLIVLDEGAADDTITGK